MRSVELLKKNNNNYDYNWGIRFHRFWLNCYGLWPDTNVTKLRVIISRIKFIFIISFIAVTVVVPQTAAMILTWGDLTIFMDVGLADFVFSLAIMKLSFMLYKNKGLGMIFKMTADDWNDALSVDEKSTLIESAKWSRRLCIVGNLLTMASVTSYHGPVLLQLDFLMRAPSNLTDVPNRKLTFISVYPFDMESIHIYKLIVYTQFIGAVAAVVGFTITDLLFSNIVLHASSMMKNLSLKIRLLNDTRENHNFLEVMKIIVERHCRIINYVERIGDVFNILLLAVFMSFTVTFCILGFCMVNYASDLMEETNGIKKFFTAVFSISHVGYLVFHVFLINWASQELINTSEEVYDEVYNYEWFNLKSHEASMWIILLLRLKHTLVINAGYFIPMNFNTFACLMKTCGGYISVLVAMRE